MFTNKTIAFIGAGTMGEAMIRGLLSQQIVQPSQIVASDHYETRTVELANKYGIQTTVDNSEAAEAGNVVVLSIKPQSFDAVMPNLHDHFDDDDLLISILAGVPIAKLSTSAEHDSIVRAMPNTPAQIGEGISVWTATSAVSDLHKQQTRAILGSLGQEIFVEEEPYLDMATALSGSGPAYVFMMMEAMIDAGVHLGFSRRIAEQLVFQTMRGSVDYAMQSGKHVAELRNQVTSPGGTTAAALYHMEKGSLRTVISRGIWAAYERSTALGEGGEPKRPNGSS